MSVYELNYTDLVKMLLVIRAYPTRNALGLIMNLNLCTHEGQTTARPAREDKKALTEVLAPTAMLYALRCKPFARVMTGRVLMAAMLRHPSVA